MKKALIALVVIVLVGVLVVVGFGLIFGGSGGGGGVPKKVLLEVDFEQGMVEYLPADSFGELFGEATPRLRDMVAALDRAAADDRVVGLVAQVGEPGLGFAQIQELRGAVERFRAAGKPAVAWSETFGEVSSGNASYYLASAFDRIYLQPSGDVNLTGLVLESMFLRGTFEKLEATPQMDHRHEYKNAMNTFTESEFTEPHREALETLMTSIYSQMVEGMAESRGLEPTALEALVDAGPYLGAEAVEAGLVDRLAYRDEVYAEVRAEVGDDADLLYLARYAERSSESGRGTEVALIHGVGNIVRGPSQFNPFDGSTVMGSDTVAAALREAVEDSSVEAILFRIDCPGGSYVASDAVWREVVRAREAGKPVIVSFGNVAASGGYFVAMAADRIVAQPATITGSIGVLGGKIVTRDSWAKLGVSFDSVSVGANAEMWSALEPYDDAEWARFQAWLDRVYEDFTAKVAEGRGLPLEQVQEIAKGRVWTGADALEVGLVDALGGYDVALAEVRSALELEADAPLVLEEFPRRGTPWDQLFAPQSENSEPTSLALVRTLETLQPMVRTARRAGLIEPPAPAVLSYPEEWVPRP